VIFSLRTSFTFFALIHTSPDSEHALLGRWFANAGAADNSNAIAAPAIRVLVLTGSSSRLCIGAR
jgi:hypothetical protein